MKHQIKIADSYPKSNQQVLTINTSMCSKKWFNYEEFLIFNTCLSYYRIFVCKLKLGIKPLLKIFVNVGQNV